MKMADPEEWYVQEEGCLDFGGSPTSVTYSATSNCFICTLQNGFVEVLDVSSGSILKRTSLAGKLLTRDFSTQNVTSWFQFYLFRL